MRYLLLWVLAGCGSSVVVGADGEGGSSGATSTSSGSGGCLPCLATSGGSSLFSPDRICPGEELEKYEAMIACACREDTCGAPEGDCHEKSDAFVLLCDGGYIGGVCSGCLYDHCLEERLACRGEEPP